MRRLILSFVAAAGLALLSVPAVAAIPANPVEKTGEALPDVAKGVEEARLYCHRNGVFLHWGPCAHDRWRYRYRPVYRPYYRPVYRPVYRPYRPYYRPYYRYRRW